jgi:prephenate dehydratase
MLFSMKVAFQGERGAYSEEAARTYFPDAEALPCPSFRRVFETVESGQAERGMVPVENSLAGSIHENYDLLQERSLHIVGEIPLRIRHCLLGLPGQKLEDLRRVMSHPQALAQCDVFTRKLGLESTPEYDTAGSAKLLAERRPPATAAIASRTAASNYGLEILAEGIETSPNNYTRFLAIAREPSPRSEKSKTTLVFATRNEPGALYKALGTFAQRNINITKIESRPGRKVAWEYAFYLDLEGHEQDGPVHEALDVLSKQCSVMRVLGSYPAWTRPLES